MSQNNDLSLAARLDAGKYDGADTILPTLVTQANLSPEDRSAISGQATRWVRAIRTQAQPGLMETFLAEYGLSTDEGVASLAASSLVPSAEFSMGIAADVVPGRRISV